ncbi:MAG: SDR family NAD(P)-dependent oxidoreductase, partial [Actinomycetota bacterium]|nr:SDR family NAD(P)-dependent oxidoreductase [Actinomycetota bacterium]
MGSLQGAVAVVTGASRGIGAAIAEELGRRGAKVVANYSGSRQPAEELSAKISEMEGRGEGIA